MNCYRLWTLPARDQDPGPVDPDLGAKGQEPVGHGPELEDQDLGQDILQFFLKIIFVSAENKSFYTPSHGIQLTVNRLSQGVILFLSPPPMNNPLRGD